MKKIFGLVAALVFISGCDDGDIDFRTFDFAQETVATCADSNSYFKINEAEVLILEIDPSTLINEVTETPRVITITPGGNTTLTYRRYDDTVTSNVLCANPVPASPGVVEEWEGDGTLLVTTVEKRNDDGVLTGYSHSIVISSVTFTGPDDVSQTINNSEFGVIDRNFGFSFDFLPAEGEEPVVVKCNSGDNDNNLLYTIKSDEALVLDHEDDLFMQTAGSVNRTLGGFQNPNTVVFKTYNGTVSSANICSLDQPISPIVTAKWTVIEGTMTVNTAEGDLAGTWEHRIYLKDVIFQNGSETIRLNDIADFNEGEGYLFGVYTTAE